MMSTNRVLSTILAVGIALLVAGGLDAGTSSIEGQFLRNVRRITNPGQFAKAGEGYFSPDGRDIVYQAVPPGYPFYQIYWQPLNGGAPLRISTGRGRTTCSYFSPDGSHILFASSHLDPKIEETEAAERRKIAEEAAQGHKRRYSWPFDPWTDIFVADREGRIVDRLTTKPGYDAEGAYSRDGKKIAFCSTRDGDPDIYVMDADGGDVRQLTNEPGYDGGPFISPDGRWVVYRTDRKKEQYLQIHVIGIDGRNDTVVTDNVGVNWAPYWHPTAPYLIWAGADHSNPNVPPNYDLWMMRYEVKGDRFMPGEWIRVTDHPSADVLPAFSPDGKQLMWTSNRGESGTSQLWIADFTLPAD